MSYLNEKVFIAWGGNQSLATAVSEKIGKYHYDGIAGGGQVTDMYLGVQILTQIRQCTQAIILVQAQSVNSENEKTNFNANMMFEWGYLTCRMPPNRVHVFLVDIQTNNLPSDLMGTWATEVKTDGRHPEEIAEEIARTFYANASQPIEINKMHIVHTWERTKDWLFRHYGGNA